MPRVIYLNARGDRRQVNVPVGTSLMRGAAAEGVDGLPGDCGGTLSCATCHVFVDDAFALLLPPMSDEENQMLDFTATARTAGSRLSCQIVMTEALEGICVRIAEQQT